MATPLVQGLLEMSGSSLEAAGAPYPLEARCGQPEEIGLVAVFLASSHASWIHGTVGVAALSGGGGGSGWERRRG